MRGLLAVVVATLIGHATARADTPPWAVGVTDAQKTNAQKSLEEGNGLFLEKKYADALAKYQQAVASWDHPAIRFNIVRCLIQLDRVVEASDNLKLALKFGAAPLEDAVYSEALAYEKLLANQIGELGVSCKQDGVKLTLDGQALVTCPGEQRRRVTPGQHQLVGTKEGFLTRTLDVVVIGGKQQDMSITLDPIATAARIEHRWPTWVPWVVFGGGIGLTTIGVLVELKAVSDMDTFDNAVATRCPMIACDESKLEDVAKYKDNAELGSKIGISVLVVGSAAAVTGGVMLYLNRGRTVYPTEVERVVPKVAPVPGGAVLMFDGSF